MQDSVLEQANLWWKLTLVYLRVELDPDEDLRPRIRKGEVVGKVMIAPCSAF